MPALPWCASRTSWFVDEQGEGASPTLAALRVYREHRAARRRGVPTDAPLDFSSTATA